MANNIVAFSTYAAKVLGTLFENFPIPVKVCVRDFVESPDVVAWLKRIDEAAASADKSTDPFAGADAGARVGQELSQTLSAAKHSQDVFRGTMTFLISEGFIRHEAEFSDAEQYSQCQLTAKGLIHLNKEFKDKQLSDQNVSFIESIKRRFSNSSNIEGATASQLFVGLVMRALVG